MSAARAAAPQLGLTLVEREVLSPDEVPHGLEALSESNALLGIPGGLTVDHYAAMIQAPHTKRLPTMFHARTEGTKEALATYGVSEVDVAREAARLVAKILRGANAGDLPLERTTKIRLVINLKTAKALGLTIPQSLLLRADQVIQ